MNAIEQSSPNGEDRMTRCGLVAVIGAPNAGKSTLVNQLVGQKVAITSAKAQTTRARMLGIAIEGETQMILVDTPGIFAPRRRLDRAMVSAAWEGTEAADAVVLLVDPVKQRRHELEPLLETLRKRPERKILVLNKVDVAKKEPLLALATRSPPSLLMALGNSRRMPTNAALNSVSAKAAPSQPCS